MPKATVYRPKYGGFIHEVIKTKKELVKKARPHTVKFRTIPVEKHRVSIAYWGKRLPSGRHKHYAVHKILHPIKTFMKKIGYRLRKGESIKARLTPAGRRVSLTALRKVVYRRKKGRRKRSSNPTGKIKVYDKVLSITARKGKGSNFPNEIFEHKFSSNHKASMYGLPDGSLLIKGSKPLWKMHRY